MTGVLLAPCGQSYNYNKSTFLAGLGWVYWRQKQAGSLSKFLFTDYKSSNISSCGVWRSQLRFWCNGASTRGKDELGLSSLDFFLCPPPLLSCAQSFPTSNKREKLQTRWVAVSHKSNTANTQKLSCQIWKWLRWPLCTVCVTTGHQVGFNCATAISDPTPSATPHRHIPVIKYLSGLTLRHLKLIWICSSLKCVGPFYFSM